jgi:hypothetical protein
MSSSPGPLKNPNELLVQHERMISALLAPFTLGVLRDLYRRGTVARSELEAILKAGDPKSSVEEWVEVGLLAAKKSGIRLSPAARRRFDHESFPAQALEGRTIEVDNDVPHFLPHAYRIKSLIGRGATSFTFLATQSGAYRDRALKLFIPGVVTFNQLNAALMKGNGIPQQGAALPELIEAGQVKLQHPDGTDVIVPCVVFQLVSGAKTFSEFLRDQDHLSPIIFERFVDRVGGALASIEAAGLVHGDLHEGNILVAIGTSTQLMTDFWVIDFIGIPSSPSKRIETRSDITNFRNHLLNAVITATERQPGFSARFLVGERVWRVLECLRTGVCTTFAQILREFHREALAVPAEHFRPPLQQPFEWLRVEFIPNPESLFKLFEPVPSRFEVISRFGNSWISGPRGCGKSHYLRVLAFHPKMVVEAKNDTELGEKLTQLNYDFRAAFGVLFACRLGEFKGFTPEAIGRSKFDPTTQAFLKHILLLKIWNKTLYALREGLACFDPSTERAVLQMPHDFRPLIEFLEERLGKVAIVQQTGALGIFDQCLAVCTAIENTAISHWSEPTLRSSRRLLNEKDLDLFFGLLKSLFPDLAHSRFYVLVDDASYGNMHYEMQKVMNSLVRGVQANHCFKITCDKFMYTLDSSDGRAIDPHQEATYVDLGEVSIKATRETLVEDLSDYMARVIDRRLEFWGAGTRIKSLLGKSQDPSTFLSALSQPGARRGKKGEPKLLRPARAKAYYGGWNIVWSISHGSVRTLLELVEHIFTSCRATKETLSIPLKNQDDAVRRYSRQRFQALPMLPGDLSGEPLGGRLQAVISAIGEVSRLYLQLYDTGDETRWYETISVDRNDRNKLDSQAVLVLEELIKYGLLLDEGVTFSRAQFGLAQRFDMNKIFAPAFRTTYRVRNHIYLSGDRFEQLLMRPDRFVAWHRTKLLKIRAKRSVTQKELLLRDPPYDEFSA